MIASGRSLVIDNYDSFTWNLVQVLRDLGDDPVVIRNDDPRLAEFGRPRRLLVSPGPGRPGAAGATLGWLRHALDSIPVLGVCLGHQALGEIFGARLERAPRPVHGKTSLVDHDGRGIFSGVRRPFRAMRYHSLLLRFDPLPAEVRISASCTEDGESLVMGLSHESLPVAGLQFHPESFLTEDGRRMLENFLSW